MLYANVEIHKTENNELAIYGPDKLIIKLIDSFEYDIKEGLVTIYIKNKALRIASKQCDVDDIAEEIILDELCLEESDVTKLVPVHYPVIADWAY